MLLAACGSSGGRVATENDRLRVKALELENQNRTLTGRIAELEAQLALSAGTPSSVPADIAANTPHLTSIALNRLSHARDDDNDGRLDTILLYIEPKDGLGRFLQIVGTVALHAAVLPSDAAAQTIGQRTIDAKELRDGYRSSFTGQYYALSLPIDAPAGASECTLRVTFHDGYSGREFSTERVISLK
jgi:hypothetical protein